MAIEIDNELKTDFLNESLDLIERVSEQLVGLERTPDDRELLNAIFRGFHTIKGSAGFFELDAVVELAHAAEDLFGLLRSGVRTLTPDLLDAILESLDQLRGMLELVAMEGVPERSDELVMVLRQMASAAGSSSLPHAGESPSRSERREGLTENGVSSPVFPSPGSSNHPLPQAGEGTSNSDPFSDDEFEALLDQLQGKPASVSATHTSSTQPACLSSLPLAGESPRAAGERGNLDSSSMAHFPGSPSPGAARHPLPQAGEGNGAAHLAAAGQADPERLEIRVDTQRLDHVMDLIGELVLVRNRIKRLGATPGTAIGELRKTFSELDVITSGLQAQVTRMRMQPIRRLFAKFPKLARDTARKLGKQVEVERIGEDTELDKTLVEALGDPLMHMVRNAVDHGLETPGVRIAAGKPTCGRIVLSAEQAGGQIVVTVSDDGAGMNADRLRAKALERGLIGEAEAARMTREECLQLVFLPGFSTKEQISDLSGRGVGMDVVRSNIVALGGVVAIESEPGRGSTIRIRLPLTLAIQPVLMIERASRLFALPLQAVQDVFTLDASLVGASDDGWERVPYRDHSLRLLRLARWTGDEHDGEREHVVVVNIGSERYGLIAGSVRGREEIVVKPLGRLLKGLSGIAGGTVTSEGRVALIVELPGLLAAYERDLSRTR
ncbi:chemotaxis protein CheA [Hydrocarboniphaga sp.]|uniref:chemotaxis protein CheA n=1 Tax=Hydrocarboniphaga sp. TaxID=2033016 RepID=UPI002AB89CF2|nr:chemotaxis protein CheA [Hydrocarboniphaga sp.]MDZ4077929.1 chemotaxis protein CheA [Hydrocarboniphaga sp.]